MTEPKANPIAAGAASTLDTMRSLLWEARACIRDLQDKDWRGVWNVDALIASIDAVLIEDGPKAPEKIP